MLARRTIDEEYLGIGARSRPYTVVDGTPLFAALMVLTIVRFIGLNSTSLY